MKANLKHEDYSPMERAVFNVLRQHKAVTADKLKTGIYARNEAPRHWRIVVNSAVRSLQDKLVQHHEDYRVRRKRLPGKHAVETELVRRSA